MSMPAALRGLRVGCVQYLNSRPLIHGLAGVELAHPSSLAARLREGALDAALVPVFELLSAPEDYCVVDGVAIGSNGPVYSVFVAHEVPMPELCAVVSDPASLTSIHLFQVLSRHAFGWTLPLVTEAEAGPAVGRLGRLLIGNQAIDYRLRHEGRGVGFWDLGEEWTRWSGLPFVYAVWVLRRGLPSMGDVADAFRSVAAAGCGAASEIARTQSEFPPEIALRYLTEQIRFQLGPREREGLERFSRELQVGGWVKPDRAPLEFV